LAGFEAIPEGEHRDIEFKGPRSSAGADKTKLAGDIIAMANIDGGGTVVGGAPEDSAKIPRLVGCTPEQLATFDQTTGRRQRARARAAAGGGLRIEKLTENGKTVAAIRVREFRDAPHIVTKDSAYPESRGTTTKNVATAGDVLVRTA
jgi:hypothetical protein